MFKRLGGIPLGIVLMVLIAWSSGAAAKTMDYTLDNGLKVILIENHRAPVASMLVWIKVGSIAEQPGEYGLTHLMEHMLFKGTERRGPGEIAREVESAGGNINAYTSYDQTVYFIDMASRFVNRGLDILSDMVLHPTIDPQELEREKEVVVEEIKMGEDNPNRVLSKALFGEVYKSHPYGRPIIGTIDSVRSVTPEIADSFYRRWYRTNNMILVVAGDFDPEKIRPVIQQCFGNAQPGSIPKMEITPETEQEAGRAEVLEAEVESTRLQMGFHIPAYEHPDTLALDLLGEILGNGRTSRLYERVKRRDELAYAISAYAYTPKDPGIFIIQAQVPTDKTSDSVRAIMHEAAILGRIQASPEELARAKLSIQSDFIHDRSTMSGEARTAANFEALAGNYQAKEKYLADLEKVTLEEIKEVAAKYLRPENLSIVAQLPEGRTNGLTPERLVKVASEAAAEGVKQADDLEDDADQEPKTYVLSNGIRLIVKPDHTLPLVAMRAAFPGGVLYETEETNGIGNLMAEVWDRGTKGRSAEDLARASEDIAAEIGSYSGRNSFGLTGEFLSRYLNEGLSLFVEVLTKPSFSPEETAKAKPNILAAIKRQNDQLTARVFQLFSKTLFDGHPYSLNVLGTPESITHLTAGDLQSFYDTWARPENMVLAIVGDVDPERIRDRLEDLLAGWTGKAEPRPTIPKPEPITQVRSVHEDLPRAQAHLILGFLAPGMDSPDRYPLEILDAILSGMGGRLFTILRDQQSLAYSVSSFYRPGVGEGAFGLYIGFAPEKYDQVLAGFEEILTELVENPVSETELNSAKEYVLGQFEIGLQKNMAQATDLALNELLGLGIDYRRRYVDGINAVTADDVLRVARQYLRLDHGVQAMVGPVESN